MPLFTQSMRLYPRRYLMPAGLITVSCILWIILAQQFQLENGGIEQRSVQLPEISPEPDLDKVIRILSWTSYHMRYKGHNEEWFREGGKPPLKECYDKGFLPTTMKCVYTNDKSQYNNSDAVLFRGRKLESIPLPLTRAPEQKWVFWEFEPPYKVWQYSNLTKFNGVFNFTATYSRDSDIPNPHDLNRMCMVKKHKYESLKHVDFTLNKGPVPVAWIASVCFTHSKRELYVKELQKYIRVDIYGKCGNHTCGSNDLSTWKETKCEEKLFNGDNGYKFYLAFENSLCDDYVSEKLWKTKDYNAVPVLMGKVDYASIMPKDSFIDVRDFRHPKDLARFLLKLDHNAALYNHYLHTKNALKCELLNKYIPWGCALCERLHKLQHTQKIVYDLAKFWGSRRCMSQGQFLATGSQPDGEFI